MTTQEIVVQTDIPVEMPQHIFEAFSLPDGKYIITTRTADMRNYILWYGSINNIVPYEIYECSIYRDSTPPSYQTSIGRIWGYKTTQEHVASLVFYPTLQLLSIFEYKDFNFEKNEARNRVRLILMF